MAPELDSGLPLSVTLKLTRITLGITVEEVNQILVYVKVKVNQTSISKSSASPSHSSATLGCGAYLCLYGFQPNVGLYRVGQIKRLTSSAPYGRRRQSQRNGTRAS